MKRVTLAVALALLLPATASAAPLSPTLNFAYELAARHWGAEPTGCVSIDKQIVDDGAIGDFRGEATQPAPGEHAVCYLYVIRDLASPRDFGLACAVMFHEYGHLLGYGHSTDPHNIMYPEVMFIPLACTHATLAVMNHPRRFDNGF